jgi:hypothetical protein
MPGKKGKSESAEGNPDVFLYHFSITGVNYEYYLNLE